MARGNNRQAIFLDDDDYGMYRDLLAKTSARFRVRCTAFCLLDNHVHLLLRPGELTVSSMLQQLHSTYCQWWNGRHGRVGHVLQGRFKMKLVDDEMYRRRVVRYVLRNPLVAGRVERLEQWNWSSYRATTGLDGVPAFLDVQDVWSMFPCAEGIRPQDQFRAFVTSDADDALEIPWLLAGPREFRGMVEPVLRPHAMTSEFVYAHRFAARPPLDRLLAITDMAIEERAATAFLVWGYTLKDIGDRVDRTPAAVWTWIRRGVRSRFSNSIRNSRSDPASRAGGRR